MGDTAEAIRQLQEQLQILQNTIAQQNNTIEQQNAQIGAIPHVLPAPAARIKPD
jgi:flagellar biosynthesis chaperone FliJ